MTSYTRVSEPERRYHLDTATHQPPPQPPPPPGHRQIPVLQPGCRTSSVAGPPVLQYSPAGSADGAARGMDASDVRDYAAEPRAAANYESVRRLPDLPDERVDGTHVGRARRDGPRGALNAPFRLGSPRAQGDVAAIDTDLALSLVNETRPSYDMKTAGKVPLSEDHLTALVHLPRSSAYNSLPHKTQPPPYEEYMKQQRPTYLTYQQMPSPTSTASSNKPTPESADLSRQLHVRTTTAAPSAHEFGAAPRSPCSPADFDPRAFCRDLNEAVAMSPRYRPPSPALKPPPVALKLASPRRPLLGDDDIDGLTRRLMHNLETGEGAAGEYNCQKCGEGISNERPGCTALNQTFHLACFICSVCNAKLAGGSFYAVEGKPYCETDYMETLDKCTTCGKPIMDRILRASGKAFHPNCFACTVCSKSLDDVPFTVDSNNLIHCVPCFHEKYAPRCAICEKPITPEAGKEESMRVVAMDKSFHVGCYKCEDCAMLLSSKVEGHGCYPLDNHLYCKNCNAERLRQLTKA